MTHADDASPAFDGRAAADGQPDRLDAGTHTTEGVKHVTDQPTLTPSILAKLPALVNYQGLPLREDGPHRFAIAPDPMRWRTDAEMEHQWGFNPPAAQAVLETLVRMAEAIGVRGLRALDVLGQLPLAPTHLLAAVLGRPESTTTTQMLLNQLVDLGLVGRRRQEVRRDLVADLHFVREPARDLLWATDGYSNEIGSHWHPDDLRHLSEWLPGLLHEYEMLDALLRSWRYGARLVTWTPHLVANPAPALAVIDWGYVTERYVLVADLGEGPSDAYTPGLRRIRRLVGATRWDEAGIDARVIVATDDPLRIPAWEAYMDELHVPQRPKYRLVYRWLVADWPSLPAALERLHAVERGHRRGCHAVWPGFGWSLASGAAGADGCHNGGVPTGVRRGVPVR